MATYTTNYNLKKPSPSDAYDIADANGNADIIDTQMKANADAIAGKQNAFSGGAVDDILSTPLTKNRVVVSGDTGKIIASAITSTQLNQLSGIKTDKTIQQQLDEKSALTLDDTPTKDSTNPVKSGGIYTALSGKQNTITGSASSVASTNLTASKVLVTNSSKKIAVSDLDSSKLAYLANVTSDIQQQLTEKGATITGGATSIISQNLTANRIAVSDSNGKVAVSTIGSGQLQYLSGVTSNIQTQLNDKQSTIGGGATTILSNNLTANRALISNASGKVAVSDVTATELGYLSGVEENIKTSLSKKAPTKHDSTGTTFGVGTTNNYGHVKLTDVITAGETSTSGKAVTSKAVSDAISSLFQMSNNVSTGSYIKFGGIMIVWKRQNVTTSSGTITFPVAFATNQYVASLTMHADSSSNGTVFITSKSVNSLSYQMNDTTATIDCIIIGVA